MTTMVVCPNAGHPGWCDGCFHNQPHERKLECTEIEKFHAPCDAPCVAVAEEEVENE